MNFEELLEFSIKELEIIESDLAKIDDASQVEEKTKDAIGYLRKLADKVVDEGEAVQGTKGSKFLCAFAQDIAFSSHIGITAEEIINNKSGICSKDKAVHVAWSAVVLTVHTAWSELRLLRDLVAKEKE